MADVADGGTAPGPPPGRHLPGTALTGDGEGDTGSRRRPRCRRTSTTALLTVLGTVVPGAGLIAAGRRWTGAAVLLLTVLAVGVAGVWVGRDPLGAASRTVSGRFLVAVTAGAVAVAVFWSLLVVLTHRALRQGPVPRTARVFGAALVGVLCLLVSVPALVVASYAQTTKRTIDQVFGPVQSATVPTAAPKPAAPDPWADIPRINILLLGGDAGEDRTGIRTDSMAVASIDTRTGNTVLISVPRSLQRLEFEPGTRLARAYPEGYVTYPGATARDPRSGENLLNAVYRNVPAQHPGILGSTDNLGADVLKLGIGYSLGLDIDYYVLVEPSGFQATVRALGGYTVDVNEPVAVGGNTDRKIPPKRWIMPGPAQHLDDYLGTWFARGRYGSASGDYDRVRRQQCAIEALTDQTSPAKLLLKYQTLAATLPDIVLTDITTATLGPLVQLGDRVRRGRLSSVVLDPDGVPGFNTSRPDWDMARAAVDAAIRRSTAPASRPTATRVPAPTATVTRRPSPPASPSPTPAGEDLAAGCAYDEAVAERAREKWQAVYGGRYDDDGLPR